MSRMVTQVRHACGLFVILVCFAFVSPARPAAFHVRLLRIVTQRRMMSIKKRKASESGTAEELRRVAEQDRLREEEVRAKRRELDAKAALDDAEAKRLLEVAKAEAATARTKELEVSRLARQEEADRREKVRTCRSLIFS